MLKEFLRTRITQVIKDGSFSESPTAFYEIKGAIRQFLLDCPDMGIAVAPDSIEVIIKIHSTELGQCDFYVRIALANGLQFTDRFTLCMTTNRILGQSCDEPSDTFEIRGSFSIPRPTLKLPPNALPLPKTPLDSDWTVGSA